MKKTLLPVLLLCILLTACGSDPSTVSTSPSCEPVSSGFHSEPPVTEQSGETPDVSALSEDGRPYDEGKNPYNIHTAVNDAFIFFVERGSVHRISRSDGSAKQIVSSQQPLIATGPNIAVFDDHIYYMCVKNGPDVQEGLAENLEMGIYRADFEGGGVTEVASTESGVHQFYSYDGYLIAYSVLIHDDKPQENIYRIFKPDSAADALEEVSLSEIGEEQLAEIHRFINPREVNEPLGDRLGLPAERGAFSTIQANDAYYGFYLASELEMYQIPFAEQGEPVRIEFPDDVKEALQNLLFMGDTAVNYDADWLYLRSGNTISRIRKDGSAYELILTDDTIQIQNFIDVIDHQVFFENHDDDIYRIDMDGDYSPIKINE